MKVHELLSDETKWTRACGARDATGRQVEPCSSNAVCWCLVGAIEKCFPSAERWRDRRLIMERISNRLSVGGAPGTHDVLDIMSWNDHATFDQVRDLVKELDI